MKEENNIILSICIATYNRKQLLLELLKDVLSYEYDDIEIIVTDNASPDGTWETISRILDKRLRIYRNDENYGAEYNWMRSLLHGNGKYLMMCNDRQIVNIDAIGEFVQKFRNIDVDVVVAFEDVQSENLNIATYEDRKCVHCKLGEPGAIIYSQNISRLFRENYHKELTKENVKEVLSKYVDSAMSSEKWYWYGKTLFIGRSDEALENVKVQRKSDGYIFAGYPKGQLAICKDMLSYVQYINPCNRKKFIRGTIMAYAHTLIWTTISSYSSPARCKRYNYTPPRHTFWFKEVCMFGWSIRKHLIALHCYDREIKEYLWKRLVKEYIEFLMRALSETKVVQMMVRIKHKCIAGVSRL